MAQKAYTKRIRETKTGKLLVRKPGGNHFNAKEKREVQLARKRPVAFTLIGKNKRFIRGTK